MRRRGEGRTRDGEEGGEKRRGDEREEERERQGGDLDREQ
jgi:hypothetical protein